MASILINGKKPVRGKLSVIRTLDDSGEKPKLIVQGQLSTHRYIEEIVEIKTNRLHLTGVNVYQESFGSEDFNILYTFTAEHLEIRGGESPLTGEEILQKELELYGGDMNESE